MLPASRARAPSVVETTVQAAWVVLPLSVLAQALGLPRLWGASAEACTIAALFFSTSLAFGAFIDEEVLYSMFFPVKKCGRGLGLSWKTRLLNWLLCHVILVTVLRICDPSQQASSREITLAFICLSYIDFVFGMACAARRRALGLEPGLGLYTIATGPAVVYTIFLAYVTIRLDVSFLQLIVTTDTAIVFMLPLIHAMVLSPHLLAIVPSLMDLRAWGVGAPARAADAQVEAAANLVRLAPLQPEEGEGSARDRWGRMRQMLLSPSAPRIVYVALSVALWWLTPPLRVAMLLSRTPPKMLAEMRTLASPPVPFNAKVLSVALALLVGLVLALLLALLLRAIFSGLVRGTDFLHSLQQRTCARLVASSKPEADPEGRPSADKSESSADAQGDVEEASGLTFVHGQDEHDVATKMFECGWGTSFHFADRRRGETSLQSMARHEYFLAGRLGVNRGARIVECGCGVGGAARNIARFTGASVTGVTPNRFHVQRGNFLSAREGAEGLVEVMHGDIMRLPFDDETFDAAYAIEFTCHSPDRVGAYAEVNRVLRPGGIFACYEWCLTDRYNHALEHHRQIREAIEIADGAVKLLSSAALEEALRQAGFYVLESRDCALDNAGGQPWYLPLTPTWNPLDWPRFQFNPIMVVAMPWLLKLGELAQLLPQGTRRTQGALHAGSWGLAKGGAEGIVTPMWLAVARKPAPSPPRGD